MQDHIAENARSQKMQDRRAEKQNPKYTSHPYNNMNNYCSIYFVFSLNENNI